MTDISKLSGLKVGAAVCGSFCTFSRAFRALSELVAAGCDVTPIMSTCAYTTDTRFGTAQEHAARRKQQRQQAHAQHTEAAQKYCGQL